VDSGTTYLYLQASAYTAFTSAMVSMGAFSKLPTTTTCAKASPTLKGFSVAFNFPAAATDGGGQESSSSEGGETVTATVPLTQLLRANCPTTGYYSLRVASSTFNILGDAFMRNQLVEFNRDTRQVGFTSNTVCSGATTTSTTTTATTTSAIVSSVGGMNTAGLGAGVGVAVVVVVAVVAVVAVVLRRRRKRGKLDNKLMTTELSKWSEL
jgi:hypothetical protein